MKLLLIEDEELAVKKLQKTLFSVDPDIEIVGTADSIASSVEWLQNNPPPDLILMDIELADGQSFEIFNRIEVNSPVIFTTSYDEYALKAFKVNSIDYLLKPIQKDDLESALDKFKHLKKSYSGSSDTSLNMNVLVRELQSKLQSKQE
ncbi:MAG: response regulator, partial [Saprospiraceae bacterium]